MTASDKLTFPHLFVFWIWVGCKFLKPNSYATEAIGNNNNKNAHLTIFCLELQIQKPFLSSSICQHLGAQHPL